MTRRSIRDKRLSSFQGEDADFTFRVDTDELVGAELNEFGRRLPRQREHHRYSSLTEDVDLTMAELCVACSDGEERLDGIVRDRTDLGVYTASSEL